MSCKVYKAFNDYFQVCKDEPVEASKGETTHTTKTSDEKTAYVPPAETDYTKYGFSKYQ